VSTAPQRERVADSEELLPGAREYTRYLSCCPLQRLLPLVPLLLVLLLPFTLLLLLLLVWLLVLLPPAKPDLSESTPRMEYSGSGAMVVDGSGLMGTYR
jgi:hypothetical protein